MSDDTSPAEDRPEDAAGDVVVGVLVLVFAAFAIVGGVGMPRRGELGIFTGPGFVPILAGAIVGLLAVVVLVKGIRRRGFAGMRPRIHELLTEDEPRRIGVLVVLSGLYAYTIGLLPFPVVTGAFLLSTYVFVGVGSAVRILVATVLCTVLAGWAVPTLFNMPMP